MYWRYECYIWDEEDHIFIRIFGEKKIGFGATLFLSQLHQRLMQTKAKTDQGNVLHEKSQTGISNESWGKLHCTILRTNIKNSDK